MCHMVSTLMISTLLRDAQEFQHPRWSACAAEPVNKNETVGARV
jgi:hypothetical protein